MRHLGEAVGIVILIGLLFFIFDPQAIGESMAQIVHGFETWTPTE